MTGLLRCLIVVTALALAGCAGRPHGILVPVAETVPGASTVDMFVATTRAKDGDPAEMFGGDRAAAPSYAVLKVSIPPDRNRKIGEIQWPARVPGDPAKDFVTLRADILDRGAAFDALHAEVARAPGHQVLVFVHGYNNKFKDAAFRFAQIVHDSGTAAAPVLFTWPSRARLLAYGYDRESTNFSRDELERLLTVLADDRRIGDVVVLAHSMGNWLTLEALRQMAIRRGRVPPKISTVMLAAPDVDVDVFRTEIRAIGTKGPKFTLFVSQDDQALALSRQLAGKARIGAIDPEKQPYKSEFQADGISVFDLTKIKSDDSHNKFAESTEVVQLIGNRLAAGQEIGDEDTTLGDKVYAAAAQAGKVAGAAASGSVGLLDPDTREELMESGSVDEASANSAK